MRLLGSLLSIYTGLDGEMEALVHPSCRDVKGPCELCRIHNLRTYFNSPLLFSIGFDSFFPLFSFFAVLVLFF